MYADEIALQGLPILLCPSVYKMPAMLLKFNCATAHLHHLHSHVCHSGSASTARVVLKLVKMPIELHRL